MNLPFHGKRKWTNLTPAQQRAFVRAFNAGNESCSVIPRKGSHDERMLAGRIGYKLKSREGTLYAVIPFSVFARNGNKCVSHPLSYTTTVYISPFR